MPMAMPSRTGKGPRKGVEKVKGEHPHWMQKLQEEEELGMPLEDAEDFHRWRWGRQGFWEKATQN